MLQIVSNDPTVEIPTVETDNGYDRLSHIPESWHNMHATVIQHDGYTYHGRIDLHDAAERINLYGIGMLTAVDERYPVSGIVCLFVHS